MVQFSITQRVTAPGENARGAILMVLAMAGFGINDIIVKHAANTLDIGQTLLIRGLFATALLWLFAKLTRKMRPLGALLQPAMCVRALAELLATLTFLIALFNIPIANATAILQALPLSVTLGAALFFGRENRMAKDCGNPCRIYWCPDNYPPRYGRFHYLFDRGFGCRIFLYYS